MDSYLRTETQLAPEAQRESTPFEMRITTQGKIRNYITYANALFTEKNCEFISLLAMGKAISKAISIAEIIKKRVPGLHQATEIGSTSFTETYTPQVPGLDPVTQTRHVSLIKITLTAGEQTSEHVADGALGDGQRRPRGRGGRGRGGRGRGRGARVYANVGGAQYSQPEQEEDEELAAPQPPQRPRNYNYSSGVSGYNNYRPDYNNENPEGSATRGRGRGGRGRGGRGRGRGGNRGPSTQQQ